MPILVATRKVRYGRKDQQPGESFEASEKDAKLLIAIGKARLSNAGAPAAVNLPAEVMSRAPVKEPEPVAEEPKEEIVPKRQYRRRDMSAEQD